MQTLEQQDGVSVFCVTIVFACIFMWDSSAQFYSAWLMILSIHKCVGVLLFSLRLRELIVKQS